MSYIPTEPSSITISFKKPFYLLHKVYHKHTFPRRLSHLVVYSVGRVLLWCPLHDSRLALVTLQGQGSLVGTKRCEFVCRGLIGVRLPVAESPSSGRVHVSTTVLPRSGKNANSLQKPMSWTRNKSFATMVCDSGVLVKGHICWTSSIASFLVKKATFWNLALLPSSVKNIT
jgi:hypothetical protein